MSHFHLPTLAIALLLLAACGGSNKSTSPTSETGLNAAPELSAENEVSVFDNEKVVQTVTATDADGDDLTFSLYGGVDGGLFAIDPNTGVLTFKSAAPDFDLLGDAAQGLFENEVLTDADHKNVYVVEVGVSDSK